MKKVSQVELKRLKKKGKVRLKKRAKAEKQPVSAASIDKGMSGSKSDEQSAPAPNSDDRLIPILEKMSEVLVRMEGKDSSPKAPEPFGPINLKELAQEPEKPIVAKKPQIPVSKPLVSYPVVEPKKKKVSSAPGTRIEFKWDQEIIRDKRGQVANISMKSTDTTVLFKLIRSKKSQLVNSIDMEITRDKGKKQIQNLVVQRDSNRLISGISLRKVPT